VRRIAVGLVVVLAVLAGALAWAARGGNDDAAAALPAGGLRGTFGSLTQKTTGAAVLVQRPDGTRVLHLRQFRTRAAPDLFVYLVPRASPSGEIWGGARLDSLYTSYGESSYTVPAGFDVGRDPTVVIWCNACHVAFASAVLRPVT
jgi:hypothetical protein